MMCSRNISSLKTMKSRSLQKGSGSLGHISIVTRAKHSLSYKPASELTSLIQSNAVRRVNNEVKVTNKINALTQSSSSLFHVSYGIKQLPSAKQISKVINPYGNRVALLNATELCHITIRAALEYPHNEKLWGDIQTGIRRQRKTLSPYQISYLMLSHAKSNQHDYRTMKTLLEEFTLKKQTASFGDWSRCIYTMGKAQIFDPSLLSFSDLYLSSTLSERINDVSIKKKEFYKEVDYFLNGCSLLKERKLAVKAVKLLEEYLVMDLGELEERLREERDEKKERVERRVIYSLEGVHDEYAASDFPLIRTIASIVSSLGDLEIVNKGIFASCAALLDVSTEPSREEKYRERLERGEKSERNAEYNDKYPYSYGRPARGKDSVVLNPSAPMGMKEKAGERPCFLPPSRITRVPWKSQDAPISASSLREVLRWDYKDMTKVIAAFAKMNFTNKYLTYRWLDMTRNSIHSLDIEQLVFSLETLIQLNATVRPLLRRIYSRMNSLLYLHQIPSIDLCHRIAQTISKCPYYFSPLLYVVTQRYERALASEMATQMPKINPEERFTGQAIRKALSREYPAEQRLEFISLSHQKSLPLSVDSSSPSLSLPASPPMSTPPTTSVTVLPSSNDKFITLAHHTLPQLKNALWKTKLSKELVENGFSSGAKHLQRMSSLLLSENGLPHSYQKRKMTSDEDFVKEHDFIPWRPIEFFLPDSIYGEDGKREILFWKALLEGVHSNNGKAVLSQLFELLPPEYDALSHHLDRLSRLLSSPLYFSAAINSSLSAFSPAAKARILKLEEVILHNLQEKKHFSYNTITKAISFSCFSQRAKKALNDCTLGMQTLAMSKLIFRHLQNAFSQLSDTLDNSSKDNRSTSLLIKLLSHALEFRDITLHGDILEELSCYDLSSLPRSCILNLIKTLVSSIDVMVNEDSEIQRELKESLLNCLKVLKDAFTVAIEQQKSLNADETLVLFTLVQEASENILLMSQSKGNLSQFSSDKEGSYRAIALMAKEVSKRIVQHKEHLINCLLDRSRRNDDSSFTRRSDKSLLPFMNNLPLLYCAKQMGIISDTSLLPLLKALYGAVEEKKDIDERVKVGEISGIPIGDMREMVFSFLQEPLFLRSFLRKETYDLFSTSIAPSKRDSNRWHHFHHMSALIDPNENKERINKSKDTEKKNYNMRKQEYLHSLLYELHVNRRKLILSIKANGSDSMKVFKKKLIEQLLRSLYEQGTMD